MFGENKNLKDSVANLGITIKDTSITVSYTKTNKLITALYMVTDIIDKDEPLRNKLRTLGVEIVSDMHLIQDNNIGHLATDIQGKISQTMSFLEIAFTINIISEMNCSILRKEFGELNQSIKESVGNTHSLNKRIDLSEFLFESPLLNKEGAGGGNSLITTSPFGHSSSTRRREIFKGHTSIGVQKGSTLMKALSDRNLGVGRPTSELRTANANDFLILKKQRRDEINNLIQKKGGNATITDIKNGAYGSLASCGEKTLQRELISMVKDGVLNKTGEKRWSRYFVK